MIEENLERIAVALELIAQSLKKDTQTIKVESFGVPTNPIQTPPTAPKPKEEEKKEESLPPVPPVPAPNPKEEEKEDPIVQLSLEELNEALMVEFERLGGDRAKIDNVTKKHGAPSLSYLDPSKYSAVLEDVKNLS